MQLPSYKELLEAGVHFGHLKSKWNPRMAPYIFAQRKGIHIIDLNATIRQLEKAQRALFSLAKSGRKILYVATKKQARDIVANAARSVNMPYVTERWLGGMLTNFATIRRSVKKMQSIEQLLNDERATSMTKKERLTLTREKNKMEKVLGGVADMHRLPAALYIVDIHHEHLAVAEANRLGIRTFAMVDTNSDPTLVDFPIPANDDSSKSVEVITKYVTEAIREGLEARKSARAEAAEQGEAAG